MRDKRHKFRIPIALHYYCTIIAVTVLSLLITGFSSQMIIQRYIATECDKRINNAVNSCQSFALAFRTNLTEEMGSTPEQIRDSLLDSIISSTDISNDASIALLSDDPTEDSEYTVVWPTASYSASTLRNTYDLLDAILDEDGLCVGEPTTTANYNGSYVYYRFVNVEYSSSDSQEQQEYEHYYLLVYINSSSYYSFSNAMNIANLRAILFALIAAAIMSIIVALPLFISTRKLAKFAQRIGRGNFAPLKGHIVSRELSDLGDVMNRMADKLEESDIEQKTFFQNASHELRTPLMSIKGYAEGLKYGVFDGAGRDSAIDIIISESDRLSGLVENLLSISKMDMSRNGSYTVKKQMLDVLELTDLVVDKVRGGFLHNGIELINSIEIGTCYIYGNENDIFRMLENIFSNCLRYARSKVTFRVSKEGRNVIFSIKDDGPGISDEVMTTLFDRFAKGSEGKHGIGLALAKAIAEEHNGSIRAHNDNGAEFEIILPLTDPRKQKSSINNER